MSFAKSWQEKGWRSQAETWQVKNILMEEFDWQVKCDVFVVSIATRTIEYNLKISLLLSLHKIRSLDFAIKFHTAYYESVFRLLKHQFKKKAKNSHFSNGVSLVFV